MRRWLALSALTLAACGSEPAAYQIDGSDVSLTVERTREYFWSDGWNLDLVVRRNPECQRRHAMKPASGAGIRVEVYTPEPGVYLLRQGKRWYVAELRSCGFQAYAEPPPQPGRLVGAFQDKEGFRFVAAADNKGAGG